MIMVFDDYRDAIENLYLDMALPLHQVGFVIGPPCPVGAKHPCLKWKRFQTQRASTYEIVRWGMEYPSHNYCIITGKAANLVIVEADDEEGQRIVAQRCIATPLQQRSGSGKGIHYGYRYPANIEKIKTEAKIIVDGVRRNIDVRGDGGLIIGPGCLHKSGGRYQSMLSWVDQVRVDEIPVYDPAWLHGDPPAPAIYPEDEIDEYEISYEGNKDLPLQQKLMLAADLLNRSPGSTWGGKGGASASGYCFKLACKLIHGYALSVDDALPLFIQWGEKPDNTRDGLYCPWKACELRHKLRDADAARDDRPRGYLLPFDAEYLLEEMIEAVVAAPINETETYPEGIET